MFKAAMFFIAVLLVVGLSAIIPIYFINRRARKNGVIK